MERAMRVMMISAGALVLALAACGRDEGPVMEEPVAAEDVAVDTVAGELAEPSAYTPDAAMQASDAPPADMTAPGPGPVTDETRANAQAEAEATNLHPRTE